MTTVQDFVYKQDRRFGGGGLNNPNHCQFSVTEMGRVTHWHQCYRKIAERIDGVGFCKLHAAEVNRRLDRSVAQKIRYAARFGDSPILAELEVVSETDQTIEIKSSKALIGNDYGLYPGKSRKNSQYLRSYKFFDDKNKAIAWLIEESSKHISYLQRTTEIAQETHNKLLEKWYEK